MRIRRLRRRNIAQRGWNKAAQILWCFGPQREREMAHWTRSDGSESVDSSDSASIDFDLINRGSGNSLNPVHGLISWSLLPPFRPQGRPQGGGNAAGSELGTTRGSDLGESRNYGRYASSREAVVITRTNLVTFNRPAISSIKECENFFRFSSYGARTLLRGLLSRYCDLPPGRGGRGRCAMDDAYSRSVSEVSCSAMPLVLANAVSAASVALASGPWLSIRLRRGVSRRDAAGSTS